MIIKKLFRNDSAYSSVLLFLIGSIVLLGSLAIVSVYFDVGLDSKNSQIDNKTTTSIKTPTLTQTATALPTATPTRTFTPTKTPSPTPTATRPPISTPTPSQYDNDKYSEFVSTVFGEAEVDTEVLLRLRAHSVVEGEVLILVMNLTARSEDDVQRAKEVNTIITSGYAQAVAHHDSGRIDGKMPKKLRIAEVNDTDAPPKTLYVNTSLARDYYLNNVNAPEFTEQYWNTSRNMTTEEEAFIEMMDRGAGNVTLYNETAD